MHFPTINSTTSPLRHSNSLQIPNHKVLGPLIPLDPARRDLRVLPHDLAVGDEPRARQVAAGLVAPVDLEVGAALDVREGDGHAVVGAARGREVREGLVGEGRGRAGGGGGGWADGYGEVEAGRDRSDVWGGKRREGGDDLQALGGVRDALGAEAGYVELGGGLARL